MTTMCIYGANFLKFILLLIFQVNLIFAPSSVTIFSQYLIIAVKRVCVVHTPKKLYAKLFYESATERRKSYKNSQIDWLQKRS
jgi:hypothetical protein